MMHQILTMDRIIAQQFSCSVNNISLFGIRCRLFEMDQNKNWTLVQAKQLNNGQIIHVKIDLLPDSQ